uniref:Uncharacterized protein n=1 Tax=Arundo donax TaxID=35708 RepID=A0A0A9EBR1_ARUDO
MQTIPFLPAVRLTVVMVPIS